jgi:hypothetical protein
MERGLALLEKIKINGTSALETFKYSDYMMNVHTE